jgi:hypothetical protein
MAFPPQGFPGIGPSAGASALDGPPPSPTAMGGAPGPFSMSGLAGALPQSIPTGQMPPEVLTGITQSAQSMSSLLDSWAQITPDKGPQLSMIKNLIQAYLADLMQSGAGPVSPTAPGPAFPGGGIDQGLAGPGSVM